jgi:predicted PilT family ATPase
VTNALSPAKVQRVSIVDDKERVMEVVVEDKQLSLAIGKKGQNVRLAAKLTGWRIDIKSEEEKRREVEAQFGALEIGEGDAAAQMDALFPDTPQSGDGNDAADLSAERLEQSEVGEGAKAEAAESGEASQNAKADVSAEAGESSEMTEPAKADEQV